MSLDTRAINRNPGASPALTARPDYRRRMRLADTLQVLCFASVALVIALFLADGGAARFATPADILTSLGVLTGLAGTDLLLIMMLLAARLPSIDRAFGQDSALALHQSLGKPALLLLLSHAGLLIVGYALAGTVIDALARPSAHVSLRTAARATAVKRYDLNNVCLPQQMQLIARLAAGAL